MDLLESVRRAKRVYIIGNGGSAANAMHIANDLVSCGIRAYALTADIATFSAIANDYGYENVFVRQLEVYGDYGDLLIALSGSGKSPNILKAIKKAEEIGMDIQLIFGNARRETMQVSEEAQLKIGHELRKALIEMAAK